MRVAINGFGRIGRSVFRILDKRDDAELIAINDVFDHDALRYLLNYDTVMGRFEGTLRLEGDELVTSHARIRMVLTASRRRHRARHCAPSSGEEATRRGPTRRLISLTWIS